jgi:predicted ester cyclase
MNRDRRTTAKSIVRRYLEACDRGDLDAMMSLASEDYVWHGTGPDGPTETRGRGVLRDAVATFLAAIPDLRVEILDLIAEGDRVAARLHESGHHRGGDLLGRKAAGSFVSWYPFDVYRVADGEIVEEWFSDNTLNILHWLVERSAEA